MNDTGSAAMKLTASAVPHSSTVGSSIKLCDETGRIVAILAILVADPTLDYKTVAAEVSENILWKLGKRPTAFRVKAEYGWDYYNEEQLAADAAGWREIDYQALYVRDGT
jgi:hypothetical protein